METDTDTWLKRELTADDIHIVGKRISNYIYIAYCKGHYKIGCTYNVSSRLSQMRTGCPFDIDLVFKKDIGNAAPLEKLLHEELVERNTRGEWYKFSKKEIKSLINSINKYGA